MVICILHVSVVVEKTESTSLTAISLFHCHTYHLLAGRSKTPDFWV